MAVNAVVELRTYKYKKQQLAMIKSQLDYLEQPKVKVSKYDDEAAGDRVSLHDQYMKLMYKKEKLKLEELQLRLDVSAIDMALEEMAITMPYETNALKLRYLEDRQYSYIECKLGFCEREIRNKIRKGERELERLLSLVK